MIPAYDKVRPSAGFSISHNDVWIVKHLSDRSAGEPVLRELLFIIVIEEKVRDVGA